MIQEYTSATTCKNQVPSLFKKIIWETSTNFDIGGGKYDTASLYLKSKGVTNLIYDPFNRSEEYNLNTLKIVSESVPNSITICNVLNVIKEREVRLEVLKLALKHFSKVVYISIYEGNRSGNECATIYGWQRNTKTADYIDEIKEVFNTNTIKRYKNNIIIK